MAHSSHDIVTLEHIVSTDDVLVELRRLDAKLGERGIEEFRLFNHAYTIVTQDILDAMHGGYFAKPAIIDEFIVIFVQYYFEALNKVTNKRLKKTSPWSKMLLYARIDSAPIFLSLLLGANAHINYDLPRALKVFVDREGDDSSLGDLAKISKILMRSGKKIASSFDEPNRKYDFLKRHFRFLYYRPAMYTILSWRIIAWKYYTSLKKDSHTMSRISARSNKIARRLLHIARILAS